MPLREPREHLYNAKPTVTAVTVLHNSADVVGGLLSSLPEDCEVIVVDNGSTDRGDVVARAVRGNARIVSRPNKGFGAGCNAGAALASGDVLLFVNPDVRVSARLVDLVAAEARACNAAVGPAITDEAGNLRYVCRRRSRILDDAVDLLAPLRRVLPISSDRNLPRESLIYATGGYVDYLQGACLAVPRELFERVGGFEERFFLYSEEEDLCDRLRAAGVRCLYLPGVQAIHLWGTSTAKVELAVAYHRFRSSVLLHGRRAGMRGGCAATAVIVAAALVRLFGITLSLPIRHSPERGYRWTLTAIRGALDGMRSAHAGRERH